jgi:hypothetical protein
MRGI